MNFVARNRIVRKAPMGVSAVISHIQNKFANQKTNAPVKSQKQDAQQSKQIC